MCVCVFIPEEKFEKKRFVESASQGHDVLSGVDQIDLCQNTWEYHC